MNSIIGSPFHDMNDPFCIDSPQLGNAFNINSPTLSCNPSPQFFLPFHSPLITPENVDNINDTNAANHTEFESFTLADSSYNTPNVSYQFPAPMLMNIINLHSNQNVPNVHCNFPNIPMSQFALPNIPMNIPYHSNNTANITDYNHFQSFECNDVYNIPMQNAQHNINEMNNARILSISPIKIRPQKQDRQQRPIMNLRSEPNIHSVINPHIHSPMAIKHELSNNNSEKNTLRRIFVKKEQISTKPKSANPKKSKIRYKRPKKVSELKNKSEITKTVRYIPSIPNLRCYEVKRHNEETRRVKNPKGGRKHTAIACVKCWKAKTRCSVKRPCDRCVRIGCEEACVDRPSWSRRRQHVKKTKNLNTKNVIINLKKINLRTDTCDKKKKKCIESHNIEMETQNKNKKMKAQNDELCCISLSAIMSGLGGVK